MSLPILVLAVLGVLAAGYITYGRFIARQYQLDDSKPTPATTVNDGLDFVPARPFYLMGQHFSAIAAAGPIVGPVLACVAFGWLPCLLWIVLGVIFIGAVHDFSALVASVRHGAHSIADIARRYLGTRAYGALVGFIWLALLYVIVAFTDVTASTFIGVSEEAEAVGSGVSTFNAGGAVAMSSVLYLLVALAMGVVQRFLRPPMWVSTLVFVPLTVGAIGAGVAFSNVLVFPVQTWYAAILVYCFVGSLLPVWLLQQPRGYLGGFVLYFAVAVGLLGVIFGGFEVRQPAMKPIADYGAFFGFSDAPAGTSPPRMTDLLFPFLFVTIACGACSGFHGLVCGGTTSKQVAKESHCRPVGFGCMLMEGFVAVIALTTVMTAVTLVDADGRTKSPSVIYGEGLAGFLSVILGWVGLEGERVSRLARTFGAMAVATFVFDTLDVSTRLGRYLLCELAFGSRRVGGGGTERSRSRVVVLGAGAIASALTAFIPLLVLLISTKGSYLAFWTLFGTSNQLLAAMTLLAITVWLRRTGRRAWFTFIPAVGVMAVTLSALAMQVLVGVRALLSTGLNDAAGSLNPAVLNAAVAVALAGLAAVFVVETHRAARGWRPS